MATVGRPQLVEQLLQLGVRRGIVLVVHTSFRRVAPVESGPGGLIEALTETVGPDGTLVMPTMTGSRALVPFDSATTPSRGMGVVAETFRRTSGVLRSSHPTSSFASRGPLAEAIIAPQPLEPSHSPDSPIGRAADHGGWVLLLGVGHDANTTIHLAENLAGVPYRVRKWTTLDVDGQERRVEYDEIDHCCRNFELVGAWLEEQGLQRGGRVGHADARLARARDILNVTVPVLHADPLTFLCSPDVRCGECDLARASVGPADG